LKDNFERVPYVFFWDVFFKLEEAKPLAKNALTKTKKEKRSKEIS